MTSDSDTLPPPAHLPSEFDGPEWDPAMRVMARVIDERLGDFLAQLRERDSGRDRRAEETATRMALAFDELSKTMLKIANQAMDNASQSSRNARDIEDLQARVKLLELHTGVERQ